MRVTKANSNTLLVYNASQKEVRAFNIIFKQLFYVKDMDVHSARKILSGARLEGASKLNRESINRCIIKWHKYGFVTLLHGRLRLGSIGLISECSMLEDYTKKLIINAIGITSE